METEAKKSEEDRKTVKKEQEKIIKNKNMSLETKPRSSTLLLSQLLCCGYETGQFEAFIHCLLDIPLHSENISTTMV